MTDYKDKYEELIAAVKQHNKEMDSECKAHAEYCIDYLATGRVCPGCFKQFKVEEV